LAAPGGEKERPMTDRERHDLHGAVRSSDVAETNYARQCGADACTTEQHVRVSRAEFRIDGAAERHWQRNADGREWSTIYEYDPAGRLVATRFEDGEGVSGLRTFEYDSAGRISRVLARSRDTTERVQETYEYDESGRKTKTIHVDLPAQIPNTNYVWGVENTDAGYGAPGAATVTTTYDYHGNPTAMLFHDAAGLPLSRVEFRYDGAGNLIEEAQIRENSSLSPQMLAHLNPAQADAVRKLLENSRRLHRYDGHGRRIETVTIRGVLSKDRKTTSYNERGDRAEEVSESEHQEYGIGDNGELSAKPDSKKTSQSEYRFHYEYDACGNWIVKTGESRFEAEGEFTVFSVERRVLAYY